MVFFCNLGVFNGVVRVIWFNYVNGGENFLGVIKYIKI